MKERERKKHWFTNREYANSLSDEKKKHTKLKSMWLIKLMRYLLVILIKRFFAVDVLSILISAFVLES